MSYYLANKLATDYREELNGSISHTIKNIIRAHEIKCTQMQRALETLNRVLDDYLVIKTYYDFPKIGSDIDILTYNFNKAIKTFLKNKFDLIEYRSQKVLFNIQGFKIHLHRNVTWADEKSIFIDNELLWTNPQTVILGQVEVKIPNANADFLIHLAHINFECFYITLPNIIHLYKLANNVNWDLLLRQARKHRWERTFRRSVKLLDTFHHTFYNEKCPFHEWNIEHCGIKDLKKVSLPLPVPRKNLVFAIMEKRLGRWVLTNRTLTPIRIFLLKVE
jgi:hypothetical protein